MDEMVKALLHKCEVQNRLIEAQRDLITGQQELIAELEKAIEMLEGGWHDA